MSDQEIKVPNLGDFKNVEVIEVLVSNGQLIKKNDPLITIESDKSSVEIPSSLDGKIKSVNIKVGDKVSEGDIILILDAMEEISKTSIKKAIVLDKNYEKKINDTPKKPSIEIDSSGLKLASPKVRKFARELGLNIDQISGSEKQGRIIEDDIKNFVSSQIGKGLENKKIESKKIIGDFLHSDFGEVEVKEIPRIKKLTAHYLTNSWTTIPHVTNHDDIDITEMEDFRNSLKDIYTGEKKKITPLAFIIKALVASLKKFPNFNSSIDNIESGKMTLKKYYHIGIAVETQNGLMVPKIRNADNKNIMFISEEVKTISNLCRNLKIDKKELFGGSMTITSLGGIGGSYFTPIINFPEVAILGVGKIQKKSIYFDGKFQTRTMLPISLSYDHRIIDGAEAARFNNDLKDNLGKNFAYKLAV